MARKKAQPTQAAARAAPPPVAWPGAAAPDMQPLSALRGYEFNSRLHPEKQVEQIAASMLRFGFTMPILAREDGTIIAGHGRAAAARILVARGHQDFAYVPVMTARGWSEEQVRAYVIADNRLAETAEWDHDMLARELAALQVAAFDGIGDIGFSAKEIARIVGEVEDRSQDAEPTIGDVKWQVIVTVEGEQAQAALVERLEGEGFQCRMLML